MKKTLQILLLLMFLAAIRANAQEIPGIQQQPRWAMPFYFEDANGEKDTVWVGYDSEAIIAIGYDSLFETFSTKDSVAFQAMLFPGHAYPVGSGSDNWVKKVEVINSKKPGINIGFNNGKMPVTMKWNNNQFYNDSLPYPDISPRPRARANLNCSNYEIGYNYCYTPSPHPPLILTDYDLPEFYPTRVYSDSFYFDGSGNISAELAIGIRITIVPHNELIVGIKETENLYADVYPNPFTDAVNIEGITGEFELIVCDITGRIIKNSTVLLQHEDILKINMADVKPGVYLLSIQNSTSHVTKIIVK